MAKIDIEKAKTNPGATFDKPADVVASKELRADEKAQILQEWELDARLMDVATEEGMAKEGIQTPSKKNLLPEIKQAQKELGVAPISDEGSPTKFTP
ncbi:hypothetical protein BH11PSE3_BH11PSE3_31670 [soil metagenome]